MRKIISVAVILLMAHILLSCGDPVKKATRAGSQVFTDSMNRQVTISGDVKRVVSMAPNVTEMLFAIGLDKGIVGVTTFCDYPDAARAKTKIGGYYDPNMEVILSLNPDLIVGTPDGYSKERVEKLDETGIPVFIINPQSIDEVLETMLTLGKVTGKEKTAKSVVDGLRSRVGAVRKEVSSIPRDKRPKVFYEIGQDPLITTGPGTFMDNLIKDAGGVNIAADAPTSWPRYSVEAVLTNEPDIIITAPHVLTADKAEADESENGWRKYRTIPAVKNNRIYAVNPDILLRPGPRVVDGLEKLYELFSKTTKAQ